MGGQVAPCVHGCLTLALETLMQEPGLVGVVAELPHSQNSVVHGSGVDVCLWAYETPRHPFASSMSY